MEWVTINDLLLPLNVKLFIAYLGLLRAEIRHHFIGYRVNITEGNTNGFLSRH